ncbi:hypothetical protein EDB83DRAFT_2403940, partial [Lactarius deliciosus]
TDGTSSPAPPRPRTQGEGWRAQPSPPRRGRHHPNPTRRAASCPHSREEGRRAHPSARATPAARLRKGEGRHVHPLRTGYASGVYAPRHARAPGGMQEVPQPSRVTHRAREEVRVMGRAARTHAKGVHGTGGRCNPSPSGERRSRAKGVRARRGGAERNPGGGVAHEQKGKHIGARVCR